MGIGGGLDNEGDLEPDVESVPLDLGITGKRLPLFGGLGGSVVSLSVSVIKRRTSMGVNSTRKNIHLLLVMIFGFRGCRSSSAFQKSL